MTSVNSLKCTLRNTRNSNSNGKDTSSKKMTKSVILKTHLEISPTHMIYNCLSSRHLFIVSWMPFSVYNLKERD